MTAELNQCSLKQWGVYRKVFDAAKSRRFGELCSLRWTWLSRSNVEPVNVLEELLDASRDLTDGRLKRLHIEPVHNTPACFALAEFEGDVVAEFEINELLPEAAPRARFLVADFTGGRVTNRPLTGFHHGEGAFLATNAGAEELLFEPMPVIGQMLPAPEILEAISLALKDAAP